MATGQVGFKDNKKVKRVYVEKRENAVINRLNKTKVEKHPDLAQEKQDRQKELRKKDRGLLQARVCRNDVLWRTTRLTHHLLGQRRSTYSKGEAAIGVGARTQIR